MIIICVAQKQINEISIPLQMKYAGDRKDKHYLKCYRGNMKKQEDSIEGERFL